MHSAVEFLKEISSVEIADIVWNEEDIIPSSNDVYIGRGPQNGVSALLVLTNKDAKIRFGKAYTSVGRLVQAQPQGLLTDCLLWKEKPLSPSAALARMRLVVEDASVDSVLSLVLLLAALADIKTEVIPEDWIAAIDDWERTGTVENPWCSWCSLASALAHSAFPANGSRNVASLRTAWTSLVRFLSECVARGIDPRAVPDMTGFDIWQNAKSALRQEEQVYRDWLPHATIVQLSLPLNVGAERRLLVDGLLFVEDQETGAAKNFYRNDTLNSPGKMGFVLSAHYRPSEVGTGYDFTISVDPRFNVHLEELWHCLESLEEKAWIDAHVSRPCDSPRYLGDDIKNIYNQPWYISPDRTIIGAPRKINGNSLGTRLSWEKIKEAIWQTYNPLNGVKVCSIGSTEKLSIFDLPPLELPGTSKNILIASWPSDSRKTGGLAARSLSSAPIVSKILSGLILRRHDEIAADLGDIAKKGTESLLVLSGGIAVIEYEGVLIIDDWRAKSLCLQDLKQIVFGLAKLDARLDAIFKGQIKPLSTKIERITKEGGNFKEIDALFREVANVMLDLVDLRASHAIPPKEVDSRAVWMAISDKWGTEKRLAAYEAEMRDLKMALETLANLTTSPVNRFIAIYGFPVFISGVLHSHLAKTINTILLKAPGTDAPWWLSLASFAGIAGLISLWLHTWLGTTNPLKHRASKKE